MDGPSRSALVTAVILAHNRKDAVNEVLDRLRVLPVDEVIVVDNGNDGTAEMIRARADDVRVIEPEQNLGIAGRNVGAAAASGKFVLFLDDDAYPLEGAVETMAEFLECNPRVGVVGGLVRDVDSADHVILESGFGTFDWWLRADDQGECPSEGFAAFFFPEGASMVRRAAFLEVGGYYEPFFMEVEGLELAARFLVGGWEVRYLPAAVFHHKRNPAGRDSLEGTIRRRIRNQVWYFWLRFPADVAARRIIAYGVFDLANTFYRGVPGAWFEGLRDAWTQRELIRGDRSPAPRTMLRRIELRRGRMHMDLMVARAKEKLSGGSGAARRRETGDPWSRATRDG